MASSAPRNCFARLPERTPKGRPCLRSIELPGIWLERWSILPGRARLGWRPSIWTFDKFEFGNVGAIPPRLQRSPADRADRVTRMRYQELFFGASVLGAAIASDNCRHPRNMSLRRARSTPTPSGPGQNHRFRRVPESRPRELRIIRTMRGEPPAPADGALLHRPLPGARGSGRRVPETTPGRFDLGVGGAMTARP
jgi:hypothetical protein